LGLCAATATSDDTNKTTSKKYRDIRIASESARRIYVTTLSVSKIMIMINVGSVQQDDSSKFMYT